MTHRLAAHLSTAHLYLAGRWRRLAASRERGSETTDKVMWIALTIVLVLGAYAIFQTKILAKLNSLDLN